MHSRAIVENISWFKDIKKGAQSPQSPSTCSKICLDMVTSTEIGEEGYTSINIFTLINIFSSNFFNHLPA